MGQPGFPYRVSVPGFIVLISSCPYVRGQRQTIDRGNQPSRCHTVPSDQYFDVQAAGGWDDDLDVIRTVRMPMVDD